MIFLFGNPTRNSGKFREVFGRMRHRWNVAQIDSRDTKKANKTLIAEWAQDYGEDSDFFRVRVKGEFPRAGSTQFIPSDLVEMAYDAARDPHVTVMDPMVIGVDVARFGDDQSVICFRRGHDARSIPPLKFRGLDLMQLAARVAEAWERFKADAVFVDETGIGAGVVDRLRMLRIPVSGISFSAKADRAYPAGDGADRAGYANKRAEIWGMMREWLKYGSIPYDRELIDDLTAVEYGYVMREGKDVILLEKKENMKQRGLASPDCFVAGTLVSTPRGPVPIEALERGDEVLTPMGVARVTWRWVSRTEALTTAKFSNGAYLTGKGAHKVFTWQGACRLDALSLTIGIDTDGRWSRMLWRLASLSFMQAASFGFKQATDTFSPGSRLTRRGYFTAAYMRTITDLSRRIGMSTTLTATGATTTPATSPSCPGAIIPRSICETELLPTLKPTNKTLLWRETRQGLGMPQTRDWTGTAGTPKPHGQTEEGSTSRVRSADPTSPPPLPVAPAIVHQPAPSAFNSGPISRTIGRALGAAMSLLRIVTGRRLVVPVSVLTESAPPTLVYNLTLDRHNAYYANGVLVFNCADALALTFAYPVGASDHRAILSKKHSHHVTDYDPTAQMIGRR